MRIFLLFIIFLLLTPRLVDAPTFSSTKRIEPNKKIEKEHVQKSLPLFPLLERKTKPMTFLLIGNDGQLKGKARSDTIIVARYHPEHRSIYLASFMRDIYVEIPTYRHRYHKLNTAYFLGGETLLKKTLKHNFNLDIDYAISVDFNGFAKLVDLIAPNGIKVNVSEKIVNDRRMNVAPGQQYLKGQDLLSYVRFRHDAESDFGRVQRQQEVLLLLKKELEKQMSSWEGIRKLPFVIQHSFQHVQTDVPLSEMLIMSNDLSHVQTVKTLRIPVSRSFKNERVPRAGAVLKIDMLKNKQALQTFFNSDVNSDVSHE
jgi:LCP family protein required for cell wall assembly